MQFMFLFCISFPALRIRDHSELEGIHKVHQVWLLSEWPIPFLISRVLKGSTCSIQCNTWELSQLKQKKIGGMCFECTEIGTLKNISSLEVCFRCPKWSNLDNFLPVKWKCDGAFPHNGHMYGCAVFFYLKWRL